jgi:hypothetical protein
MRAILLPAGLNQHGPFPRELKRIF